MKIENQVLSDEEIKILIALVSKAEDKGYKANRALCKKLSRRFDTFVVNLTEGTLEIDGVTYTIEHVSFLK